MTAEA